MWLVSYTIVINGTIKLVTFTLVIERKAFDNKNFLKQCFANCDFCNLQATQLATLSVINIIKILKYQVCHLLNSLDEKIALL